MIKLILYFFNIEKGNHNSEIRILAFIIIDKLKHFLKNPIIYYCKLPRENFTNFQVGILKMIVYTFLRDFKNKMK